VEKTERAPSDNGDRQDRPVIRQWFDKALSETPVVIRGLILCATIGLAAAFLSEHYGAPVMLFALLLGMALNPVSEHGPLMPGITFASRTVLKVGVALLGVRITTGDVYELGATPVLLAVFGVGLTIGAGLFAARLSGRSASFGILTGGAVGICGASAALALATVLPKGKNGVTERCVIFTVLAVTTLSTVAMVLYPLIADALALDDRAAGIFIGATVHDVAQVVGAGYSISQETGDVATVTKLFRVALLVPVVAILSFVFLDWARGGKDGAGKAARWPQVPLFLVAFVAAVALNSFGLIPAAAGAVLSDVSRWCLVTAIAALGIKTSLKELGDIGSAALAIVITQTLLLAGFVLVVLGWLA